MNQCPDFVPACHQLGDQRTTDVSCTAGDKNTAALLIIHILSLPPKKYGNQRPVDFL